MSQILINNYLRQLDIIKKVSGSRRETNLREAFKDLLKAWGKQHDLTFIAEYPLKTATKTNIEVDGALLHELRMPLGYWEAKDADDDLDGEVSRKLRKGFRFADYKDQVFDLLTRMTTVGMETVRVVEAIKAANR